jgi:hypothetical protein
MDFKCLICKKNNPFNLDQSQTLNKKQNNKVTGKFKDRKLIECNLNAFGFYWQLGSKELA